MTRNLHNQTSMKKWRGGFSLLEVAIASLLVGLMLVGAMKAIGAATRAGIATSERGQAFLLAESLMSEILQTAYSEPTGTSTFGREVGEAAGDRSAYDDVDDFHKWDSEPETRQGGSMTDWAGWRRRVWVEHVDPTDLTNVLSDADDLGVKRITVTVEHNGVVLASLVGIQTKTWIDTIPEPDNDRTTGARPPVNQTPTAVAAGSPLSGGPLVLTVTFDGTGSSDPEAEPLSYAWDFGDGAVATGPKPSHTFGLPGTYTVTMTVTDVWGATDTDTLTVVVNLL